jgi:hypothetical protein
MATICFPGLLNNLDKWFESCLYTRYLNLNKCKEAIQFLKENPEYIDWEILSTNPAAIDLLLENYTKIEWIHFCKNPAAIEFLLQDEDAIVWNAFSENPHPAAIELLTKNKDMIDYYALGTNPGAAELIIEQLETGFVVNITTTYPHYKIKNKLKINYIRRLCMNESTELINYIYTHYNEYIDWKVLSCNSGAVDILLENMHKIDYISLSANSHPKIIKLMMEVYPHYIDWKIFIKHVPDYAFIVKSNPVLNDWIWANPIIFDYNAITKYKMDMIKEELMMKSLHPKRIERWLEQGLDIDDL